MQLLGSSGKQYSLGPMINQGGEGRIYEVIGSPGVVAKVYKPNVNVAEKEMKLRAMSSMVNGKPSGGLTFTTWPLDLLYDKGRFAGFTMIRIPKNKKINEIYDTSSSLVYNWGSKLTFAYNLCVVVESIHKINQVCGDFNPNNICVDTTRGIIYLIDTDSFHITHNGNTYRCSVGMQHYLPKNIQELLNRGESLSQTPLPTFSKETDNFALAIHIFQLLMNGCHPFALRKVDFNDSSTLPPIEKNILDGNTIFFSNNSSFDVPIFSPRMDIFPDYVKNMFKRAFVDSYSKGLGECPTASEWMKVLKTLKNELRICMNNDLHFYYNKLNYCPWCKIEEDLNRMLMPPSTTRKVTATGGGKKQVVNKYPKLTVTKDGYADNNDYLFKCEGRKAHILAYKGKSRDITIPSHIDVGRILEVSSIGDSSFRGNNVIEKVTVPNTVKSIGESAFSDCSSLKEIVLSDVVTKVDEWAFAYCTSLVSIRLSKQIKSISDFTFYGCSRLSNIIIPDGVTVIRDYAFARCSSLSNIVLPNSLKNIRNNVFYECVGLRKIIIPSSVEIMGKRTFSRCGKLESVILPNKIDEIPQYCFDCCFSLKSISLPSKLKKIRPYSFNNCHSLVAITIPSYVNRILSKAFDGCISLSSVSIMSPTTKIDNNAFPKTAKIK